MQHLDGNALAGIMSELFAFDSTMASVRCAGCGTDSLMATAMVYLDAMGAVARCPHCDDVLLTLVESEERVWIGFGGASAIEVAKS